MESLWAEFSALVDAIPGKTALVLTDASIDFATLKADAERVSVYLAAQGVQRGDVVAIQLPKRRETYALWLACLRRGAIHAFLDPRSPDGRLATSLERLKPKFLATIGATANPYGQTLSLPDATTGAAWLSQLEHPSSPATAASGLHAPAYVMFTSGSTGEPKGAVIAAGGVASLMNWVRTQVCAPKSERFSNINPLHFDNAVFDLYGGLLNGATLVPVETSAMVNPAHWVKRLRQGEASVIFAVPTLFLTLERLALMTPETLPSARLFLFGGEGFPVARLAAFRHLFEGRARLVNVYGPTETSCICSSIEIDAQAIDQAQDSGGTFPSIGRMHPGFEHAILDHNEAPVAPGTFGELWIGGGNVGLGYFNNPEETQRRFRQDPGQANYRSIWYRTGDLVREDADGLMWFGGRVDNQVKIRGHRIELEEIDLAIEAFPGVQRAIAVAAVGSDGPELRAAFCAAGDLDIDFDKLKEHCRARLPTYMQPTVVRRIDALPLNANGKVDRKATAQLLMADLP